MAAGVSRPWKLTDAAIEEASTAARLGIGRGGIASAVGISGQAFAEWMSVGRAVDRGERPKRVIKGKPSPYPKEYKALCLRFYRAVTEGEARVRKQMSATVMSAAMGRKREVVTTYPDGRVERTQVDVTPPDVRAAMWWLDRHPEEGLGERGEPVITLDVGGMTEDQLRALSGPAPEPVNREATIIDADYETVGARRIAMDDE